MKTTAIAMQVAEAISIKKCKALLAGELLYQDTDELFYQLETHRYIYVFKYGVICFYNCDQALIKKIKTRLAPACSEVFPEPIVKKLNINIGGSSNLVTYGQVTLKAANTDAIRLAMLNVSQSVALDAYGNLSESILEETRIHTSYLEKHGKLDLKDRRLKKYIGKVLNIKNKISENLYIFEAHESSNQEESLSRLDNDLKKIFDLQDRYRAISEQLNIIKDNLDLFKDIMFHKESSKLEWIIIILILVEVIDLFVLKIITP